MEILENFRTVMVNCPELIPLTAGFCLTMASLYRIELNEERKYLARDKTTSVDDDSRSRYDTKQR